MEIGPLGSLDPVTAWAVLFAGVVLVAAFGAFALEGLTRFRRRGRLRLQAARGRAGETRAEGLLRREGWLVEGRQVAHRYEVRVDGLPLKVDLRADFVVRRGGYRYVAEVKTGRHAVRLDTSATRRQLLEYRIAFDVEGVVLVDAEANTVRLVEFPLGQVNRLGRGPGGAWVLAWALACLVAAVGMGFTLFGRGP